MDLALFDFDNTITRRDMFTAFIKYAVPTKRRLTFVVFLFPVILAYKCKLISATLCRRIVVFFGFRGLTHKDISLLGKLFCTQVIPKYIRERARQRITWHQQRGDKVVVVSASLDVYLNHWCEQHGLVIICSVLDCNGTVLNGKYQYSDCTGEEKARQVLSRFDLSEFDTIYAYGDSKEDVAMLNLADIKFFNWQIINPR